MVAVARKGEAPIAEVAVDFGVSESCPQRWLKLDDIKAGQRLSHSSDQSADLRELSPRTRREFRTGYPLPSTREVAGAERGHGR